MEENPKTIIYKGDRYSLRKGYYIYTERLHRRIWKDEVGDIPANHHIHHKNGDGTDNRIENLECIHQSDHHAIHFDKEKVLRILHSKEVSARAHEWHKTKSAREQLSSFSKAQWESRQPITRTCTICAIEFLTKNFAGTKYCSQKCRTLSGYRSSLIDLQCVICGNYFRAQKNRSRTCSSKCAGALSSRTKSGVMHDPLPKSK